ncbi:MAG: cyclic nucleotide-binding domain-containing protein [Chloroflexota bacterium]
MIGNAFDGLALFQGLQPEQIELLKPLFHLSQETAGNILFEQGGPACNLYLVLEGEIAIRFKPEDGPEIVIVRVRAEGVVGWSAALGSATYTSSAVCTSDCTVLRIRGQDLRALCENHPQTGTLILERLAAVVAERLRNTHPHVVALLEQGMRT